MHIEMIGEDSGKTIGFRVIEVSPERSIFEVSFYEKGHFFGDEFETYGTYLSEVKCDGSEYAEGKGVTTMKNGSVVTFNAHSIGRATGKGQAGKHKAAILFKTDSKSEKLQRLCSSPIMAIYESDDHGNTRTKYYEWQP